MTQVKKRWDERVGKRMIHRIFRTRGTILAADGPRLLIEFDNTDTQLLTAASVRPLNREDLVPEERFSRAQRVRDWRSGLHYRVVKQEGDRVAAQAEKSGMFETLPANRLIKVRA